MNDNQVIDTIEGEYTDLRLHVAICHERYIQFIAKLDHVDARLGDIEVSVSEIKQLLQSNRADALRTYLGWAGVVITGMAGFIVYHLKL